MKTKRICVFGSYRDLEKRDKEDIITLGRLLAEKGFEVLSGGFGGTMEYVSKGAKEAGGKTIGVTYYKRKYSVRTKANKYIDEEIKANDIFERIDIMLQRSDGFIILPGGTGTLLELAACIEHVNKGIMPPKPIVAIGNFWRGVAELLSEEPVLSEEARKASGALSCKDLITFAHSVREAVSKLPV